MAWSGEERLWRAGHGLHRPSWVGRAGQRGGERVREMVLTDTTTEHNPPATAGRGAAALDPHDPPLLLPKFKSCRRKDTD